MKKHITQSIDDKTRKYLIPVDKEYSVETTYVDYENKHIICFSSMLGCPVGCVFCVSGKRGVVRNLTTAEMIGQCLTVIEAEKIDVVGKPILFSCMGEGEPLLNADNVITALLELEILYPNCKLALSTSGAKPFAIEKLAQVEFQQPFKLQVSIHHMHDEEREKIIPITHSLERIMRSVDVYKASLNSKRGLEFNYVLIGDVNDYLQNAEHLAILADGHTIKLNVLNPVEGCEFESSDWVDEFVDALERFGAKYEVYRTNGADIGAACGQLTYQKDLDNEVEFVIESTEFV